MPFWKQEWRRWCGKEELETAENPLAFWRENEARYPHVAFMARSIFIIPASQASNERLFSFLGYTTSLRRNRMSTSTFGDMATLAVHLKGKARIEAVLSKLALLDIKDPGPPRREEPEERGQPRSLARRVEEELEALLQLEAENAFTELELDPT